MSRIRTIKPEFWKHEDLSALPEATHLLAAALLNYSDDFGFFNANPELVRAECSPLREPSVRITESFRRLQGIGYIALGTCPKGRRYGRICNFSNHQRVSNPTPSKIQLFSITWDDLENPTENIVSPTENIVLEQGTGNREREQGSGKESSPNGEVTNFNLFWKAYPKRVAKGHALKAYKLAKKRGATDEQIRSGAERYAIACRQAGTEKQFIRYPATWLNGDGWLDEDGPSSGDSTNGRDTAWVGTAIQKLMASGATREIIGSLGLDGISTNAGREKWLAGKIKEIGGAP